MTVVDEGVTPRRIRQFLARNHQIRKLLIAGNRESVSPGIGDRTDAFLRRLFRA